MAGAVEGIRITGKSKKKTNIFWSTVPENEQFRNVRVPGVDLEVSANNKMNLKRQEPGVTSSRVVLLTSRKTTKTQRKTTGALQADVSNTDTDTVDVNVSDNSSRRASIKNLTIEDKKRVANLIKELAKTGEEREFALERLQEERVSFEQRLCAVQEEQMSLRLERESLRDELKRGQELLKKYETELEAVKRQKEEQALMLSKQSVAFAQGTQTSPAVTTSPDTSTESNTTNCRTSHETKHPSQGHLSSQIPQLPVYSNTLYDLKTSKVEQPVKSSGKQVEDVRLLNGGRSGQSGVAESLGLHELYLREYKLQLHLQEQQLEVQRQQVILQEHLQMLQQLQMQNQNLEPQYGDTEEPQLVQHAGLGRTTNQAQFLEEMNEVPHGTQGPFIQQQSRGNVVRDFTANHSSQNDQLLQEPQNSWSHRSQVIDGIPLQSNHSYRDYEYGNATQPVSHNFQTISERNQQCDHLMNHHRAPEPSHHSPEHIGEQYLPAESYHRRPERQYLPVSLTQRPNDMHLAGPEQHGQQLDRRGVQDNYYFHEGLPGQFDIEHHYPPESSARQSRQSYYQPEEHMNAVRAKHDLHPTQYHRQQSKQDDFSTEQRVSLANKYSPTEQQHFNTKPYTREGHCLPTPNTYYSSEFNDQHHLRQSSVPTDMTHSMTRKQVFYPAARQHSPRKESGLYRTSDVPTDNNNNFQPNHRHQNQSFLSNATLRTTPVRSYADQVSSRLVNAQIPLDQYISNYQNFTGYNRSHTNSNNANSLTASKRKMDPRDAFDVIGEQVGMQNDQRRKTTRGNKEQRWVEKQDTPLYRGYSLHKTKLETPPSPKDPRRSSISATAVRTASQNYPNSLMQIIEHLEVNNETSTSPNVRSPTRYAVMLNGEEENDVLDDIFFLKR